MLVGGPKPAVHSPPFGEHLVIDQSLIKSGFDLELLLGERYIKYFLLTSFETGSIPWWTRDVNEDTGEVTNIIIHPPIELEQNRLYQPHSDFVPHPFLDTVPFVYTESPDAMEVTLLPNEEDADIRVQLIVSAIAPPLTPGFPPIVLTEQQMHIDARFFVQSDLLPSGFQGNVRLRLELVDIGGPFIAVASGLPGFDKERTLARMKEARSCRSRPRSSSRRTRTIRPRVSGCM
jgi:hypothetical protein